MRFSLLNLICFVTIAALVAALVAVCTINDRRVVITTTSYSVVTFEFSESLIKRSPSWNQSDEHPPLSYRQVARISDGIVKHLNECSSALQLNGWYLHTISLSPLDLYNDKPQYWCYGLQFYAQSHDPTKDRYEQHLMSFTAIVLMDGSVVVGEGNDFKEIDSAMAKIYTANSRPN